MIRSSIILLFPLSLTGCASTEIPEIAITKPPINVTKTSGFKSKGITGYYTTAFHVVANPIKDKKSRSEVAADCRLEGDGFVINLRTPRQVKLPTYGKNTKPISGTCSYNGITKKVSMSPENISGLKRSTTAWAVGMGLGGAVYGETLKNISKSYRQGDQIGYQSNAWWSM